jgi:hypothetical protein
MPGFGVMWCSVPCKGLTLLGEACPNLVFSGMLGKIGRAGLIYFTMKHQDLIHGRANEAGFYITTFFTEYSSTSYARNKEIPAKSG